MSIGSVLLLLQAHTQYIYLILFLGALFETIIVTAFFIYGEVFFIAGAVLAGMGVVQLWIVMLTVYLGGFLGDSISYWIGRKWGKRIYNYLSVKPFFKRYFNEEKYENGIDFFKKYGGRSVFTGRFLGPVSWVTPFLAGSFKLTYRRFIIFDIPAVILGIGQFILGGYIFGKNYKVLLILMQQYILLFLFASFISLGTLFYFRKKLHRLGISTSGALGLYFYELLHGNTKVYKKTIINLLLFIVATILLYFVFLIVLYFGPLQKQTPPIQPYSTGTFTSVDQVIKSIDETTYYKNGTKDIGPINIVIITKVPIKILLKKADWYSGKSILQNGITLRRFFKALRSGYLPVSDLYFKGSPQNKVFIFGNEPSFIRREHLRIWNYGSLNGIPVYIGQVSKDTGFDMYKNHRFLVLLHSLDPNIDKSRSFFVSTLQSGTSTSTIKYYRSVFKPRTVVSGGKDALYFTDGRIVVVKF